MNVIRKKPKQAVGGDQGYGATAKKGDAVGGAQGMVVDQQQAAPEYGAAAANRASAAATKQVSNANRGSEFKKNAQ